jgi:hypothetical protein
MRLGAEHGDVVQLGRDLDQLLERAHAGHAVADHHQHGARGDTHGQFIADRAR